MFVMIWETSQARQIPHMCMKPNENPVFSQTHYTAYTETLLSFPRKDLLRTASIKRKLHIGRSLLAHLLLIIQNFRAIRSLHLLRIR